MSEFETTVQRAMGEHAPIVACHKGDIFQDADAGMTVAVSATKRGGETSEGILKGPTGGPLSGYLTQWQDYPNDSPFRGGTVEVGWIEIKNDSNDVTIVWQGQPRTMDSWCINTFLGGTDSEGDAWTISLTAFRI